MDLPLFLEINDFVTSDEELRQSIYTLIKTPFMKFLQDPNMGSEVNIHASDADLLEEGVRNTVEQIAGITVQSCQVLGETVLLELTYFGDIKKFEFNTTTI